MVSTDPRMASPGGEPTFAKDSVNGAVRQILDTCAGASASQRPPVAFFLQASFLAQR
jgi:hypothetical protein